MTSVTVLLTGGTIGQRNRRGGSVADADATHALVRGVASAATSVRAVEVMQRDSPDMTADDWRILAEAADAELRAGADGVVILHGTDTLAYSAAALARALGERRRPVVLTGSMLPADAPGSDAAGNLSAAMRVATSNVSGVVVVFGAGVPGQAYVLDPLRLLKVRTADTAAFAPVAGAPLGRVIGDCVELPLQPATLDEPEPVRSRFDGDVDLVKVTPLLSGSRMRRLLEGLRGVVVEGFGSGHVSRVQLTALAAFPGPVIVTTQVLGDAERLGSYASDRALLDLPNVVPVGATTSVSALVSLSWALGEGLDPRAVLTDGTQTDSRA